MNDEATIAAPTTHTPVVIDLEQIEVAREFLDGVRRVLSDAYSVSLDADEQARRKLALVTDDEGTPVASDRVKQLVHQIREAVGCGDFDNMLSVDTNDASEELNSLPSYVRDVDQAIESLKSARADDISSAIENVEAEFQYVQNAVPSDVSEFLDSFTAVADGDLCERRDRIVAALSELQELGV